jgi:hypothetical protein
MKMKLVITSRIAAWLLEAGKRPPDCTIFWRSGGTTYKAQSDAPGISE